MKILRKDKLLGYDWLEVFTHGGVRYNPDGGGTEGLYSNGASAPKGPGFVDLDVDLSPFGIMDVEFVFAHAEGENDGADWKAAGLLTDGRWFYVSAWCDYTGWG